MTTEEKEELKELLLKPGNVIDDQGILTMAKQAFLGIKSHDKIERIKELLKKL